MNDLTSPFACVQCRVPININKSDKLSTNYHIFFILNYLQFLPCLIQWFMIICGHVLILQHQYPCCKCWKDKLYMEKFLEHYCGMDSLGVHVTWHSWLCWNHGLPTIFFQKVVLVQKWAFHYVEIDNIRVFLMNSKTPCIALLGALVLHKMWHHWHKKKEEDPKLTYYVEIYMNYKYYNYMLNKKSFFLILFLYWTWTCRLLL